MIATAVISAIALPGGIPAVWAQLSLPVYQVIQSGATAAQAESLARNLSIPSGALSLSNGEAFFLDGSNFMAVPAVQVTDPTIISNLTAGTKNDYPNIPLRFEKIEFDTLGRMQVVGSNAALSMVTRAFDSSNLLPQFGMPSIAHSMLSAYWSNQADVVISNGVFLDTSVKYHFSTPGTVAPGYPIIGPGAQVQVTYGSTGAVTRLHYATRRYSEGQMVAIISPSTASNRVARLFPGFNAQLTPQLVYYAPPLSLGTVSNLIPYYAWTGTATVTNPATQRPTMLNLTTPLIPATDDPAHVPSATLSANVVGGTQVVASVRVTGGMRPYTYLWSGSSPSISSNTGSEISYTAVVRTEPPTLRISRVSLREIMISWMDPTGAFMLESTPGLERPNWMPMTNPVQTDNGMRSVLIALDVAQPMFFRLLYSRQTIAEMVMVTVTDANGVQAEASQTLQVQPMLQMSGVGPRGQASPKIAGVVDWGTESPYDPGLGVNDRVSWTSAMTAFGGGVQRFLWTGNMAWRWDFIEEPNGIDDYEVDNADIVLYIGHGNPEVITFTGTDNLYYPDAPKAWGSRDQEWMGFLSCSVLQFSDPAGEVWDRWGPNFDGLHILLGFSTSAGAETGFPGSFAFNMLGFFLFPPNSIVNAWFSAANSHGTGTPAALGPIGPGGVWDYGDYYWGKGAVGPTIRASQIRGWWYLN
ncbi:MAG TPA: DUF6345 domain-containing protein [Verrucomicrobiae bacterium]